MTRQNDLLLLHGRLLAGDGRAASKIVEIAIAPLVGIVNREVQGLQDPQIAEQASIDALFDYLAEPDGYNPTRAQLITYLAAIAKGKAMTMRRSETREVRRNTQYSEAERECSVDDLTDEDRLLRRFDWQKLPERFGDKLFKEPGDDLVFALMASGETSSAAFAKALGLAGDTVGKAEADRRVERMRGRIRRVGKAVGV